MPEKTNSPLTNKLSVFTGLTPGERRWIAQSESNPEVVQKGAEIISASQNDDYVVVLLSGWACRYKLLPDGRRQILSIVLPGDFIGLRAGLFGMSDHSVAALNECVIAKIPLENFIDVFSVNPRLAMIISWSTAREETMMVERLVSLGARNAYERMAQLLLEIWQRLKTVGAVQKGRAFNFPLTQEDVADLLGLSVVHTNRTLRALRHDKLIDYDNTSIQLLKPNQLVKVCSFDNNYIQKTDTPELMEQKLKKLKK